MELINDWRNPSSQVEEIEVVEEFITPSGDEENAQSESDKSEEKTEKTIPKGRILVRCL